MCGRYVLATSRAKLAAYFGTLTPPFQLSPRYNVAPSQPVLVVRPAATGRELVEMRWGIVPAWKHGSVPLLINARAETADLGHGIGGKRPRRQPAPVDVEGVRREAWGERPIVKPKLLVQ